jgi:hypothetical protein
LAGGTASASRRSTAGRASTALHELEAAVEIRLDPAPDVLGGLEVSEARRLRALEHENSRLKRIVADLTLDNQASRSSSEKRPDAVAQQTAVRRSRRSSR